MTRLGGRSNPWLRLGGLERAAELIAYGLASDDGETLLTSAFKGDDQRPHFLTGEAYQETRAAALWRYTRQHSGEVVPFVLSPNGNPAPSTDAPFYAGQVVVGPKPDMGGAAEDRWFRFRFVWDLIAEPDEITTPAALAAWEASHG